jgi:CheY-like chemotaxis protein
MTKILLCSSNPILVKSLYGMLRDEGHDVETVEHPALAVQKVMFSLYDLIIIDSEPFGLSTEDAVQIIKTVEPDLPIVYVGGGRKEVPSMAVDAPVDLEEFKRAIHSITV